MKLFRASGILLHPTSLPGPFGIGDFGKECFTFLEFLLLTEQKIWQINPLTPTGFGDSPYQCFSSFAGNPLLINLAKLEEWGWLEAEDLTGGSFSEEKVNFEAVQKFKKKAFQKAYAYFLEKASALDQKKFLNFCHRQESWLNDFTLFMALKDQFQGKAWNTWDNDLVLRNKETLERWRLKLDREIGYYQFLQFVFFQQWQEIRAYCQTNGIKIIGDLPLYPAYDSADVWTHPDLFTLDKQRQMTFVAGVPPDYFSKKGQFWGNPLYRWEVMKEEHYRWWKQRIRYSLEMVDLLRLDHFRGFESYWEIPAGSEDARSGRWVPGPADHFFTAMEEEFGRLPFIAEDLGIIPPEVDRLREMFGLPGMKILQFAFDGKSATHPYLPHQYDKNCVVYTGTHDNEPMLSWWEQVDVGIKEQVLRYLGKQSVQIHREMIRLALASAANFAIFPLQDILGLGKESRMNTPSLAEGNWTWRMKPEQITKEMMEMLGNWTRTFGR